MFLLHLFEKALDAIGEGNENKFLLIVYTIFCKRHA